MTDFRNDTLSRGTKHTESAMVTLVTEHNGSSAFSVAPAVNFQSFGAGIQISQCSKIKGNSIQRDTHSYCTNATEAKSLIQVETETSHTKENVTIAPTQKYTETQLLESWPGNSARHQSHTGKVEAQVSALKNYFDRELSSLNNTFDTISEHVNNILNHITGPSERLNIETSNINFLLSELTSRNEMIMLRRKSDVRLLMQ